MDSIAVKNRATLNNPVVTLSGKNGRTEVLAYAYGAVFAVDSFIQAQAGARKACRYGVAESRVGERKRVRKFVFNVSGDVADEAAACRAGAAFVDGPDAAFEEDAVGGVAVAERADGIGHAVEDNGRR